MLPFKKPTAKSVKNLYYKTLKKSILLFILFGLSTIMIYAQPCVGVNINIDFELKPDNSPFQVGEVLTTQYSDFGITFSSRMANGSVNTANPLVIFDSSEPDFGASLPNDASDGDCDLGTPSFECPSNGSDNDDDCAGTFPGKATGQNAGGENNCTALGRLLIVEEHWKDAYLNNTINNANPTLGQDNLDDSPDDKASGGIIQVDFAQSIDVVSLRFVDEASGTLTATKSDNSTEVLNFAIQGDNDALVVDANFSDVMKLEINISGSGGFADLQLCLPLGQVPVEIISFSGEALELFNVLNWETSSEIDNDYFEVQRYNVSDKTFETVGKVNGNGTTSQNLAYSFIDRQISSSTDYQYRLKQIDFSGNFENSNIISVNRREFNNQINVYPNPARDFIEININKPVKTATVLQIFNIRGQLVGSQKLEVGAMNTRLSVHELESGRYFAKVMDAGKESSISFIKL